MRGSPLDKLVAELMIVANSTWGGVLAEKGIPAIYRAQSAGKVRMTTSPQAHDGLGVAQYAWSSSPLRRYVDLLNQWQLVACLNGDTPHFGAKSDALFAAMRDFELTYGAYAEFQRGMERYWCMRWLCQEDVRTIEATIRRDNLVKLDNLPLIQRVNSVPELKPGQRIRLSIESVDYLTLELGCRYVETLDLAEKNAEEIDDTLEVIN
ncbi:MAG TPA: RNB domain-containing ribonuclease, partial [Candidatus Propionivibrio aalborgensis]|nr:RNB domain-containing ribonuclease [Candidatus Propionivibrio aalborgensis]